LLLLTLFYSLLLFKNPTRFNSISRGLLLHRTASLYDKHAASG
jgi:hypothetical protein